MTLQTVLALVLVLAAGLWLAAHLFRRAVAKPESACSDCGPAKGSSCGSCSSCPGGNR